tara:strand:- start:866198 stop:869449 length:3252 start_codon:yes stop_codon:yes gene_type:complete
MSNPKLLFAVLLVSQLWADHLSAQFFLVKDGQPRSEIIIAESPTRMQRLAAAEFRQQIEKICGVRLPIVTRPTGQAVKVFIGASTHNPVSADGLSHGAYRITSGDDWLTLIGDDSDFVPAEPFARSNSDIPRALAKWRAIVEAPYGLPSRGLYKHRMRLPSDVGLPDAVVTKPNESFEAWGLDERGSFNAVCGFLRKLGARWYMPGEIGEVLPQLASIPLPKIDETVKPDFRLRQFNFRFGNCGEKTAMWAMRLGIRNDERLMIAHGLSRMTNHDEVFAAHPEWFAIYGGKRDFQSGDSKCQLCYSDPGLFQETVRFARALLDTFPLETVSIMPPDGYTAICQCKDCMGKDSPERHERGRLSNHVWDFVNRVAIEVAKTHPNGRIINCAYGAYTLPPDNIGKLDPHVQVCIVGGRRPINKVGAKGEGPVAPDVLRSAWAQKTDNPLLIFENFPFTDRGWYLPSFAPEALIETVKATKGLSEGEDIWLSAGRDFATDNIGFNHILVYFTARSYWGGPHLDTEGMIQEYCRLFYGPAASEMRAFLRYCEANWKEMEQDKTRADKALAMFAAAQAKVDSDSLYAKRLATIDRYLDGLRSKAQQLAQKRGQVPVVRLVGKTDEIIIDGRLDDAYWQNCPTAATGMLRELQTGRRPTFGTHFKTGWIGTDLYFAIRCDEHKNETPRNAATSDDDPAIWHGDAIELLIATETHSYYQIAISPSGAVVDLDRGATRKGALGWDSKAEVATHIADDHWTVEIRMPITSDENDPLNQIIGRKPIQSLPWHINVCRQRIRDDGHEYSALSPTSSKSFHDSMKFAHFYAGKSHRFEFDPKVTDFASEFAKATRQRKPAPFIMLAELPDVTDFQKAIALEQAALLDKATASELIERIPIEAVRKSVQLRLGKASIMIDQFADEDISRWPFWKRSDGYFSRGRAHLAIKNGAAAERDLNAALRWTSDEKMRQSIHNAIGRNRETNLTDDQGALSAYRAVIEHRERLGGSDEFSAAQSIARILKPQGKFEEALATLARIDTENQRGTWRYSTLLARGEVHRAAGDIAKAREVFQKILDDSDTDARFRAVAETRLREL